MATIRTTLTFGVPFSGLLLLAAHGLRGGDIPLTVAFLLFALLLFSKQAWMRLAASAVLFAGSLYWVRVCLSLAMVRMQMDQDWVRLTVILGGVALFTLCGSLILLGSEAAKQFSGSFGNNQHADDPHVPDSAVPKAVTFLLTLALLWISREKATTVTLLMADRLFPQWGGWGVVQMLFVALYAVFVCGMLLQRGKVRKWRPRFWAFFSVVFFGQLALGVMGFDIMLMTGDLHLPVPALIVAGPLFRGGGFFMLILFSVSVLLVGPAWCSHLCYIGAWDDQLSRQQKGACGQLPVWTRYARWAIAAAVFGSAMLFRATGVSGAMAALLAALFGLAGVAVMLVVSRRMKTMAHCSAFCPLGLAGNLLGRLSPWRLRFNNSCTQCGACKAVCRYNAITDQRLAIGRPALSCSLCRECTTVCRHGAAELTLPFVSSRNAIRIFVVLIATLHAVFLAVARM